MIIDYSQHPNTSRCAVAQIHPTSRLFENLSCKQGIVLLKKTFFYCLGLNIHKVQNVPVPLQDSADSSTETPNPKGAAQK